MKTSLPIALVFLAASMLLVPDSLARQRALEHEDVDTWNRLSGQSISRDGQWLLWNEGPTEKDQTLMVRRIDGSSKFQDERATGALFSGDSRHVAFRIVPATDSVRAAKLAKVKDDDMPKDSLGILNLETGLVDRIGRLMSFSFPEEAGTHMAYRLLKEETESDSSAAEPDSTEVEEESEEDDEDEEEKEPGTRLVVRTLADGSELFFDDVTDYVWTSDGTALAFAVSSENGEGDGVYILRSDSSNPISVTTGLGNYKHLVVDESGRQVAFLTDHQTYESDQPVFDLVVASTMGELVRTVEGFEAEGLPEEWWISENGSLSFSDSGNRVLLGTSPRPEPDEDDEEDVLEEEKVVLDVWSWTDPLLQPMQLLQAERERNRTYQAVLDVESGTLVQLEREDMPNVTISHQGDGRTALGTSNLPYRKESSWESPGFVDAWLVDTSTGERQQIQTALQGSISLSPDGKYATWWDGYDLAWKAIDMADLSEINLTRDIPHSLANELHDWPYMTGSSGSAGWTEGDELFLVYDAHDLWAVDPTGQRAPYSVTDGVGRRDNLRFNLIDLDPDEPGFDPEEEAIFTVLDRTTKDAGFYADRIEGNRQPERLLMSSHRYGYPRKAEEADVLFFTRESFREYDDLWTSDLRFSSPEKQSEVNAQQADFTWGTEELYSWTSLDGQPLQGILVKPDGFDPGKEYPMMVYFYEKYSNQLHQHSAPAFGSSSINFAFYVSRGYVLFIPDIPYKVGYPGESAMNAVMPGITSLIEEGFIDADRIGVQGHSWGGYQIAYMVTRTNLFAAAEAGAPVSNMTSAYGGIRWGSGMSRMFQYEKTQSRIGGTLWNAQQRYIHNSPLFQADKVQTPLLMMHNDKDGAVPWYQGIEMFVALRRLGSPVWMLNYNGEDHGLRQHKNRRDWSIRMQQFFDHYLLGSPAPVWLEDGVPAVQKGETLGLEVEVPAGG